MTVTSLHLEHACGCDGMMKITRKRNHNVSDAQDANDALHDHQPTKRREGNTKQFTAFAQKVTSILVKTGQAAAAIGSLSSDATEAQISQCMMLLSLFKAHKHSNTQGTFTLEKEP